MYYVLEVNVYRYSMGGKRFAGSCSCCEVVLFQFHLVFLQLVPREHSHTHIWLLCEGWVENRCSCTQTRQRNVVSYSELSKHLIDSYEKVIKNLL